MNKIVFAVLAITVLGVSSCKRCYECYLSNGVDTEKICYGDPKHKVLRNGGKLTNDQGQEMECF
jgi:hypothetical protein